MAVVAAFKNGAAALSRDPILLVIGLYNRGVSSGKRDRSYSLQVLFRAARYQKVPSCLYRRVPKTDQNLRRCAGTRRRLTTPYVR